MTRSETFTGRSASPYGFKFGSFRLVLSERRLARGDNTVELGGRALDILIALVERAGEVIPKKELISRVWPDVVVDEGSLRFHLVALRKALGEDESTRYVASITGQGYYFVAPVSFLSPDENLSWQRPSLICHSSLPPKPVGVVGRDQIIRTISERLLVSRFLSVVGPGGVGKTTVALCVGHALRAYFGDGIEFVDLAQISDANLVGAEIAKAVGLTQYSSDATPGLISFLRSQKILIILDNCEHVISAAAALTESLIRETAHLYILATSRETLQVEGERVQRLFPLDLPPEDGVHTAEEALQYSAVRLFVDRAGSNDESFVLGEDNVTTVIDICRRLDGLALAIELAAGGVGGYGLRETAALLQEPFTLPLRGRRTAAPRQQTLRETLDWSYTLLSDFERAAIRRLAVFVGPFTIEAAKAVIADGGTGHGDVFEAVANLVSKSLVIADVHTAVPRYRFLETTRTYVHEISADLGENDEIARSHAIYMCNSPRAEEAEARALGKSEWLGLYGARLGDVRAALAWSFSPRGDAAVAVALTGAASPLFLELSLLPECHHWTERAIALLDDDSRGTALEMKLQACFAQATMLALGNREQVRCALQRALDIAVRLDDVDHVVRILGQLTLFHFRIGDFRGALSFAVQAEPLAQDRPTLNSTAASYRMPGAAIHLMGCEGRALPHCEAAANRPTRLGESARPATVCSIDA